MTRTLRTVAAAAALVMVAAACGATPSTSPSPSAASPGAVTSPSPSAVTSPSPVASPTPEPSVDRHGAADLETRLADEIGGVAMEKVSLTGEDFIKTGSTASQSQMTELLGQLGRATTDLTVAEAYDPAGLLVFKEGLFRVAGADPTQLLSQWVASQQAATGNRLQVSSTTVAGRDLTRLIDPARQVGTTTYAFADGDTLWLIGADDIKLVEEAVGKVG